MKINNAHNMTNAELASAVINFIGDTPTDLEVELANRLEKIEEKTQSYSSLPVEKKRAIYRICQWYALNFIVAEMPPLELGGTIKPSRDQLSDAKAKQIDEFLANGYDTEGFIFSETTEEIAYNDSSLFEYFEAVSDSSLSNVIDCLEEIQ